LIAILFGHLIMAVWGSNIKKERKKEKKERKREISYASTPKTHRASIGMH